MTIPEEIVETAKGCMLKFGQHPPMVYVHGTEKKVYMKVPLGKDNPERCGILMRYGMYLANEGGVGNLEFVCYVSEGWASPPRKTFTRPSLDPDRSEVLLINGLDVKANAQILETFVCIRDKHETVVELKPLPSPDGVVEVKSNLLPSFVAGYTLFQRK